MTEKMEVKIEAKQPVKSHVFEAICNVQAKLAEIGIGKTKRNVEQKYDFRGIDDVYNTLSPLLAKNQLVVIPRVMDRTVSQYTTKFGTLMFNVAVTVRYAIVSAVDGSKTYAIAPGEASDSGDKATNKAMSAAYKYMMFQLFCIPIDVLDADATTPPEAVNPNYQPQQKPPQAQQQKPQGNQQNNQQAQKPQQKPQGNNQSNNQGNNQKPQQQKPQGSQQGNQKQEAKKSTRTQPFNEQELAVIENEITVAAADGNGEKLHEIGGMLGVERAWIQPAEKLKALVVKCLGSRSGIVTKKTLHGFEEMVKRFASVGILTQTEALSLRNNSRSILNEQLITQ